MTAQTETGTGQTTSAVASAALNALATPNRTNMAKTDATAVATASSSLVSTLVCAGFDRAFGVLGGYIEKLLDAMDSHPNMSVMTSSSEHSAALQAAAYFRASKKPAVVYGTAGAGASNAVNGVASAYAQSHPLLLITPVVAQGDTYALPVQGFIDTHSLFDPITCANIRVNSIDELEGALHMAIDKMNYFSKPAHLTIPQNILAEAPEAFTPYQPITFDDDLTFIKDDFTQGDVMVIGSEYHNNIEDLIAIAEQYGLLLVETPDSRGFIPDDHPNYCGSVGLAGTAKAVEVLQSAKNVVVMGQFLSKLHGLDRIVGNVHLVSSQLDKHWTASGANRHYYTEEKLLSLIKSNAMGTPYRADPTKVSYDYQRGLTDQICTADLMAYVSENSAPNLNVFMDAGNSFLYGINGWKAKKKGAHYEQLIHTETNNATMGWALPSAVGAAHTTSEKQVVFTGDGSFNMASDELAYIKLHSLNVMVIVLNDAKLGMAMHGQRMSGARQTNFELSTVDYAKRAEAYGIESYTVKCLADLDKVDLHSTKPVLLDVHVDPEAIPPMVTRMAQLNENILN